MRLTVTTWNINSVRLRINSVARFIKAVRPDVLCLQETKCPDDRFHAGSPKPWLGMSKASQGGLRAAHRLVVPQR